MPCYLIRHGQSEWNVLELTQGQTVAPRLTELGRDQARAAAAAIGADLGERRVRVVGTSDLVRARETAEIVVESLGGELRLDPRLREQHLGDLEGRSYAETWAAAERHDWSDPHLPVAGGESPHQLRTRIAAALADVDPGDGAVGHLHPGRVLGLVAGQVRHRGADRVAVADQDRDDSRVAPAGLRWLRP